MATASMVRIIAKRAPTALVTYLLVMKFWKREGAFTRYGSDVGIRSSGRMFSPPVRWGLASRGMAIEYHRALLMVNLRLCRRVCRWLKSYVRMPVSCVVKKWTVSA
jgi:hypothetical protein